MDIAKLALEDGTVFTGRAFGARGEVDGEVVFNTSMTGYQEILTDPSYHGQIVAMTYPLIGNYGVNAEDAESGRPWVRGFVDPRAEPARQQLPRGGLARRLPGRARRHRHRRDRHPGPRPPDARAGGDEGHPLDDRPRRRRLVAKAKASPGLVGRDLAREVMPDGASTWEPGLRRAPRPRRRRRRGPSEGRRPHVVALDFGMKWNIPRHLVETRLPGDGRPRLDAGRGDPRARARRDLPLQRPRRPRRARRRRPRRIRTLIKTAAESRGIPIFGICLGHQLLGQAFGARTFKLKFGHRGANHPVRDERTGKVEITTQNHGFAVDPATLPADVEPSHVNLNDQTLEGLRHTRLPVFSVQYHPEASAGPHDSQYLFGEFRELMG